MNALMKRSLFACIALTLLSGCTTAPTLPTPVFSPQQAKLVADYQAIIVSDTIFSIPISTSDSLIFNHCTFGQMTQTAQ
jgi:uncharacterized lipoprotein YajG